MCRTATTLKHEVLLALPCSPNRPSILQLPSATAYDRVWVRYRGNGTREDVERGLLPVAEKLDALGVAWEWEVPDGRYAVLVVWKDARLQAG